MSSDYVDNQVKGRPSADGEAAFSVVRDEEGRARPGAQKRGSYESEAQALADIWDPKKRKEREEAAAAEAAAAAAAAAAFAEERVAEETVKGDVLRATLEGDAARGPQREQGGEARLAQAYPSSSRDTMQEVDEKGDSAAAKLRLSLPEVVQERKPLDPDSIPSIVTLPEIEIPDSQEKPRFVVITAPHAEEPSGPEVPVQSLQETEEQPDSEGYDPEATAELPAIRLDEDASVEEGAKADEAGESEKGAEGEEQPSDGEVGARAGRAEKPSRRKPSKERQAAKPRGSATSRHRVPWKLILGAFALVVVACALLATYLGFSRWVLVDDVADFKGSWHLSGQPVSVVVSDTEMKLADEITYSYVLDTKAKVVTETFGNMVGSSRYRFSEDRKSVALFDDGSSDWWKNAMSDLGWYVDCVIASATGATTPDLLGGESGIILYRAGYDAPGVSLATSKPAEDATNAQENVPGAAETSSGTDSSMVE